MDRRVSPRLTYWTGIWEPGREALSKEVELLRRRLAPRARVVSFSSGQRSRLLPQGGAIRLSAKRDVALRGLAALLEPFGDLNHVVGAMDSWHLLRVLGRRPILFTVAIEGKPLESSLYDKVSAFAAESRPLADALVRAGVPSAKIHVRYPGVDLARFRPGPRRAAPFRVLFASSPATPADFERRGIPLMVEAARQCPEVEVVLLWRRWGQVEACVRALHTLGLPPNLRVDVRDVSDMAALFQSVDATLFLPESGHGKSAPNSVIEGLASGCPAILNRACGISDLVEAHGGGLVIDRREPRAVADAMRELASNAGDHAAAARALAERHFSEADFLDDYATLYQEMCGEGCRPINRRRAAGLPSARSL
jgi:glycosyltransferase involved in cell wall biosynthesis